MIRNRGPIACRERKESPAGVILEEGSLIMTRLAFLALLATAAIAQTTGPGTGLERKSKPGELQTKAKAVDKKGVPMTPEKPIPVPATASKMEDKLDRPVEVGAGERQ